MNRRSFLISSSAAALATALPLPALPAPVYVGVDLATGPDLLAFTVGIAVPTGILLDAIQRSQTIVWGEEERVLA